MVGSKSGGNAPVEVEALYIHPRLGGGFNFFYFHPYLGKIPILTNIFQMG